VACILLRILSSMGWILIWYPMLSEKLNKLFILGLEAMIH
jgi:hypothetical protein